MKPMHGKEYILRGGRIVDPVNGVDAVGDVGVQNGYIVPPASLLAPEVIDCRGLVVCPGFIDMHVHLRDPGQTHKEDLVSGTQAAAAGGFTSVLAMPNTEPPLDTPERIQELLARAEAEGAVRVLASACLTRNRSGNELTAAAALKKAGAVALTDDGGRVANREIMHQAFIQAKAAGLPIVDHCEDEDLTAGGVMHAGAVARKLKLPGKPAVSEIAAVERNIELAAECGWNVHIQHISAGAAVAAVRSARAAGIQVSAEATPHHICLTDAAVELYGVNAKMNPPLRSEADRQAILHGLQDGTIEVIATDHAPHTDTEKASGMLQAPSGIIGLECAVPLCLTELYHSGLLSLSQFVSKFTAGPRRILNLEYGSLTPGAPADITILNLDIEHIIRVQDFVSRSRNCPFDGWRCRGRAVAAMVAGEFVLKLFP